MLIHIALNPFNTLFLATNDCLCARNFNFAPSYFALDTFLSVNSRDTYASSPELTIGCSILLKFILIEFSPSYPFVSKEKILKEGQQLHRDALMRRNEDINVMDRPLREEQLRPRRIARIS